jgi:hypothetical protein
MRPPVLEIGWEFEQKQPILYMAEGISQIGTGTSAYLSATGIKEMKALRIRLKLKGRANVFVKASFNIDKLFYNDLIFDLDEFVAYLFGDIYLIFAHQPIDTTWENFYKTLNLCWSFGYSYTDLTMAIETLFKFPSCYKMLIDSFTNWSQWTSIITKFGTKQFLFGLLDMCTMSSDSMQIPWEY